MEFMLNGPGFLALLVALFLSYRIQGQTYSATYLPSNAPAQTEEGQTGTNRCGSGSNQTSDCQNAYINSVTDFCIWAPPQPGPDSLIGNTERIEVAWCIKDGTGTRLIPDGVISGAHFVQTPDFVQVTGVGNLTFLNVPALDAGGELDPHGADGNGNPIGGLVFSSAFGQLQQIFEWTNFISDTQFCFRACKPGPMAPTFCQHIYDVMGCNWNMPASYEPGIFENCKGDSGEPMGVYGASTFHQGEPVTPSAHPPPSSSSCTTLSTIGNGLVVAATSTTTSTTTSATPAVTPPSSSIPTQGTSTGVPVASRSVSSGGVASPTGISNGASYVTPTDAVFASMFGLAAVWAAVATMQLL